MSSHREAIHHRLFRIAPQVRCARELRFSRSPAARSRTIQIALRSKHLNFRKLLGRDSNDRLEIPAADHGAEHVGICKVRASNYCASEVGTRQIGSREIRTGDICAYELSLFEVGPHKVRTSQVGNTEIGEFELKQRIVDTNKVSKLALQSSYAHQIDSRQSGSCLRDCCLRDCCFRNR